MPNYKMETIYAYKMARSLTIIDYNHPIASKEAHNILPQPKCRDISYKWWNVVFLKVHQALYKISKEYQTVLGRHSLHCAYWPQRQVCSIPVYWQFLQFFLSGGDIRYGKILKPKVTLWRFFYLFWRLYYFSSTVNEQHFLTSLSFLLFRRRFSSWNKYSCYDKCGK